MYKIDFAYQQIVIGTKMDEKFFTVNNNNYYIIFNLAIHSFE